MTEPALAHKTDKGRFYTHPANSREVPSITNVKGVKGVDALKYWAANECAQYTADNAAKLVNLSPDDIYALVKKAPFSRTGKKAMTSLVGDIVHDWIDQAAKGTSIDDINLNLNTWVDRFGEEKEVPVQARWTWNQFAGNGDSFLNVMKPEWVLSEFTVWSDKYEYAGTMDWAAKVGGKRLMTLGDNKTGAKVYADMALQLAAGTYADYVLMPDANEACGYRRIDVPQFDMHAILHLRPRGWSLVPIYKIPEAFEAFIGLRKTFEWMTTYEDDTVGFASKYAVKAGK